MIKNVSANRFLGFAFEKYCFYNKNRKRRINCRGIAIGGEGGGGMGAIAPPTLISKPKKVQEFQFQTSGILTFMSV